MSIGIAIALVVLVLVLRIFFKVSRWVIRLALLCVVAAILVMHFMRTP